MLDCITYPGYKLVRFLTIEGKVLYETLQLMSRISATAQRSSQLSSFF